MIKAISIFRRRPGMTREEFKRYYEENHVPLARSLLPQLGDYRRNYIMPIVDPLGNSGVNNVPFDYDVISEGWFESRAQREEFVKAMSDPAIRARIVEDENNFFDRTNMLKFEVEEYK